MKRLARRFLAWLLRDQRAIRIEVAMAADPNALRWALAILHEARMRVVRANVEQFGSHQPGDPIFAKLYRASGYLGAQLTDAETYSLEGNIS